MTYLITPLRSDDRLVTFCDDAPLAEIQRGAGLAGALGCRCTRKPIGWIMSAPKARKWETLFEAGFEFFYTRGGSVRFRREPCESKRLSDALRAAVLQGMEVLS